MTPLKKTVAVIIEFAASKGFDFTAEDISAFEAEAQKELSMEELDKINGGGFVLDFIRKRLLKREDA